MEPTTDSARAWDAVRRAEGNGARPNPIAVELTERRQRLRHVLRGTPADGEIHALLHQVDDALERLRAGTFGRCEACDDPIEESRILADPLVRVCLGCLSDTQRRELEDDLELASRIQRTLLPRQELVCGGWEVQFHYQPAGPVSGDYCDVMLPARDDDGFHFVFGDVSGKGVSASILMSNLQAIFRGLVGSGLPVGPMVERANRMFCETTLSSYFATLVSGRVEKDGSVELVNAGHWPPLVLRRGRIQPLEAGGLPVGMFSTSRYEVQKLRLERGEVLFLHTDGLSEARDGRDREYGLERVRRVLAEAPDHTATAVNATFLEDLAAFRGDSPPSDDLTLMTLRRT